MNPTAKNFRTLAEMVVVILVAELVIMEILGHLRLPEGHGFLVGLIDALALVLIAGPVLLWRMGATDAAGRHAAEECPAALNQMRHLATRASVVVLLAGAVVALTASLQLRRQGRELASGEFSRVTESIRTQISSRLDMLVAELEACKRFFRASQVVDRAEFSEFTRATDLLEHAPGTVGIGYISRVAPTDLEAFVATQRADGAPDFPTLTAHPDGAWSSVLTFLEPPKAGRLAVGRDLSSDSVIQDAAERAMRTGLPALSGRVEGTTDHRGDPLFVYLSPVYGPGDPPQTPEERKQRLAGWVFVPVSVNGLFAGLAEIADGWVDLEVYDGRLHTPEALIFDENGGSHEELESGDSFQRAYCRNQALTFNGQDWTVWMGSTREFEAAHIQLQPVVILLGGLATTVLLTVVIWGFGESRARAITLAARMTESLREREREAREALATLDTYKRAVDQLAIIAVTDTKGRIVEANDKFVEISGYSREELLGRTHTFLSSDRHPKSFWVDFWRTLSSGRQWSGVICNRAKDGSLHWVNTASGPIHDADGTISGYIAVRVDITEQKRVEEELRRAAFADALTGLGNRAMLAASLTETLEVRREDPMARFAVLVIDFDRFALINDTLGHEVGDAVLREAADRLRGAVGRDLGPDGQPGDILLTRVDADGFALLIRNLHDDQRAVALGEHLLELFAEPFHPGGRELFLTSSVGVAFDHDGTTNAEEVLHHADMALHEAKIRGRGRLERFDPEMGDRIKRRLHTENDLRAALGSDQFFLVYQPIVALDANRIEGFETLLRWRHPTRGVIPPDEFIPIAERSGLILPLGEWVLREACRQYARWREVLGPMAPHHISVNLSRRQLVQQDLPDTIRGILRETGVPPGDLYLEITETTIMQDIASGARLLQAIREIGVKQSLDDFGTGHSSLASLNELPVEIVKIDRSFVANLDRGRRFIALVHAATELASNLGMVIVAEGIETADQVATLQAMGCEYGQGYYFSKPLEADAVPAFLSAWGHAARGAA